MMRSRQHYIEKKVEEILIDDSEEVCTFEGGRYTNDVRTRCYELLSQNVSVM